MGASGGTDDNGETKYKTFLSRITSHTTHLYFTIIISYNYAIGYQYATPTHREKMESG